MRLLSGFFSLFVICALFLSNINQANAQAESGTFEDFVSVFVPCANDGAGEIVSGVVTIHYMFNKNGVHFQPQGGVLYGETTGDKFNATGVTRETAHPNNYTFINRFHIVGKGTQFYVKQTFHITFNANGELTAVVDNFEVICK